MSSQSTEDKPNFWKWLITDGGWKDKGFINNWIILHGILGILGSCVFYDKSPAWFAINGTLFLAIAIIVALCIPISNHYTTLLLDKRLNYLQNNDPQGIRYFAYCFQYAMLLIMVNILIIFFVIFVAPEIINILCFFNLYHIYIEYPLRFFCFFSFSFLVRLCWQMINIISVMSIHAKENELNQAKEAKKIRERHLQRGVYRGNRLKVR